MGVSCLILFITMVGFVMSDEISGERLHCDSDSCDTTAEDKIVEDDEVKRDSGVHLAYSCSAPQYVPEEDVPVILLHGLTDSRKTWNGIYQNIPVLTHRKACVYDARNHGDSSWNDTFNVDVLAEDLGNFMDERKFEKAVLVGHSMGGLTAMTFAIKNPNRVDRLFVEDISPIRMPENALFFVIAWANLLQTSISHIPEGTDETTARKIITEYIQEATQAPPPESFLKYAPMQQSNGVWKWKMNCDVIMKTLANPESFYTTPEGRYEGKTYFLYGKASQFKVETQEEEIRKLFPDSEFFGVEGAGHIIHSKHPEFVTNLIKFLQ